MKRHGRLRVAAAASRRSASPRRSPRRAVAEVFAEVDEDALLAQALDRSALRRGAAASPTQAAVCRRVHRYLLAQGFDAGRVHAAIRSRVKNAPS